MSTQRKIILASSSRSRRQLLQQIGLKFSVEGSSFDEDSITSLSPRQLVKKLSQGKARTVAKKYPNAIIIWADTIGMVKGKLLGKPKNKADAKRMLRALSGRQNISITAFTIIDTASGREITKVVETKVYFRTLTDQEINAYVASGEPLNHAGAYAIQGSGVLLVRKVDGEYSTIAGLPLATLAETLKKFDIHVL